MTSTEIMAMLRTADCFVVRDYSACAESENPDEPPVIAVVPADAIFEVIERAHKNHSKITISPVGPPILNWK